MTVSAEPRRSVRRIRQRLLGLLLQALGTVVLLTVVLLLGLVLLLFVRALDGTTRPSLPQRAPAQQVLEAYYLGHGSWEGVEAAVRLATGDQDGWPPWGSVLLLDETGRVVLDHGRADGPLVGQPYWPAPDELRSPLRAGGQVIGTLVVVRDGSWLEPIRVAAGLLIPIGALSIPLGALTVLIGFLLVRRFINPLADVMAAAHAVAGGELGARVPVRGPGDLRGLTDSFNHMAEALERNDRQRRALLADVAHELRTPLTVMRGKLEGIIDGIYPADEAHIAPVLAETYTLERLVEDLRTLTLAEARQLHFDLQPVQLGELAERAAGLYAAEAAERAIRLSLRVEPGLPPVRADPQRVSQVIGNLLSNALRYVPEDGAVELAVGDATALAAGEVVLAVSDTGPGVPEADLAWLFDRFWRGDKSRSRAGGGAGLGLAIARQLIEAQGGRITARNRPGGGLEVAFGLPALRAGQGP